MSNLGPPSASELDNARLVYEVLKDVIGRESRISSDELSHRSGVYQPYISTAVRVAAMHVAPKGVVIGSVRGLGGGYFRAETKAEAWEIVKSRLLEMHTHCERDLVSAQQARHGLRGATLRRQINVIAGLENARFQLRSALAEHGVLIGEFAMDATEPADA